MFVLKLSGIQNDFLFSDKVANFLRFSWAEMSAFLNMFYEEEEREADIIR